MQKPLTEAIEHKGEDDAVVMVKKEGRGDWLQEGMDYFLAFGLRHIVQCVLILAKRGGQCYEILSVLQ